MAIDPIESALRALATHFASAVPSLTEAIVGFPEANHALQLDSDSAAVLSVSQIGDPVYEHTAPEQVDIVNGQPATVTYRTHYLTINVQLDLWTPYKAIREDVGVLIESALHNRLPLNTGLWLTTADYFGRALTCVATATRIDDEDGDSARGEWRKSWDLSISTDLVIETSQAQLDELRLNLSTELGTDVVVEPVKSIP